VVAISDYTELLRRQNLSSGATSRRHVRAGIYVLRRAYSKNKFSDGNAGAGQ
jgi:hypothetical protein